MPAGHSEEEHARARIKPFDPGEIMGPDAPVLKWPGADLYLLTVRVTAMGEEFHRTFGFGEPTSWEALSAMVDDLVEGYEVFGRTVVSWEYGELWQSPEAAEIYGY